MTILMCEPAEGQQEVARVLNYYGICGVWGEKYQNLVARQELPEFGRYFVV